MTRVKVCGLTREVDVEAATAAGVDFLGFVFAPSPRQVTPDEARALIRAARAADFDGRAVGVFVDADVEEIRHVVDTAALDIVQLHGSESDDVVREAADRTPVWRALRVGVDWTAERLTSAGLAVDVAADALVLDRFVPGVVGGTGRSFDATKAHELATKRAVVLAGGLTEATVEMAIRRAHPMAVDVSTGVETSPGVKDPERIRGFVAAVRRATTGGGGG